MNVFVSGATGVLGHRLVDHLVDRGHAVAGLVRDDAGADLVTERGGDPRRGDVLDGESIQGAVGEDTDVIVHAATAIPTANKPSEEAWARNDRVREEGARNLLAAAPDDLSQFVFPSVVWVARQPDGSAFDESVERHPDRGTQSAAAVEDLLRERGREDGFDVAILRCGFFYAPDSAHTRQFGRGLLEGALPVVGGGLLGRRDAPLSFLHADDAARAHAEAVDAGLDGVYHVVDEEPAPVDAVLSDLADRLGVSSPRRVPAWLARVFVGTVTAEMLSSPMPTTAEKFRAATDWTPQYPTYREGFEQVVETWREAGTLSETAEGYEWTDA
ncbi:MAG: NAD-dependent epimerase/dehydratase family protein [Haloarculaceae archaeon]